MKRLIPILIAGFALAACATGASDDQKASSSGPQMVIGKTWQWVSSTTPAEKITVAAPERYTILLQTAGRAQVRFDCNRGGGDYKIAEGQLSFGPLISTRMACPADTQDWSFMRDLQRVASFFVREGLLYLELPYDSGIMQFRQAP
jgi:heat shock protein HslJ